MIALSKRPANQDAEHVDTEPYGLIILIHRTPPKLVVEPGAWVTGEEERRIADFTKQHRAIMAQDSSASDKENLALAIFNYMVAAFEDPPRPRRATPSMYHPDYVSSIDHPESGTCDKSLPLQVGLPGAEGD